MSWRVADDAHANRRLRVPLLVCALVTRMARSECALRALEIRHARLYPLCKLMEPLIFHYSNEF
jgi:hypothetical protein